MKYTITHSCNHEQTHQLYGRHADRENRLEWLKTTVCSDCYKAAQIAQREAANVAAAEANKSAGLPELTGSEKQIAWAESIRAQRIAELAEYAPGIAAIRATGQNLDQCEKLEGIIAEITNKSEARWWIDTRDEYTDTMIRDRMVK